MNRQQKELNKQQGNTQKGGIGGGQQDVQKKQTGQDVGVKQGEQVKKPQ